MKKVLVTGGSGFIGSNLIRSLLGPEHDIYLLVQPNDTLWRIKDIADKITVFYIGLTEFSTINTVISVIKPDIIFHLASFGGMPYETDPKSIFDVNFYGTLNLLNACKKVGFECFINTGSSSEYGKKNIPMHEDLVLEPISDYAVSKAASTQFCLKEALFNNLPIYTVRPFSVYGDAELHTRLIPTIALSLVCNEPLQLSSPRLVRDFIYIDDMLSLLHAVAEKKPKNHFIFNAGSGIQSSIQDAVNAAQLLRAVPVEVEWGKHTPRPWEPTHWVADITRSQKILGWTPRFTLTAGLEKTVIWFKNNLHLYGERLGAYVPASSTSKQQDVS